MSRGVVLVTGASGFVGSRLLPALSREGWDVRAGSRDAERGRAQRPEHQWVTLDLEKPSSLAPALEGVRVAFYLVHSLADAAPGYEQREAEQARRFREAAERAGVERIVYLGGLAPRGTPSRHLAGRLAVGETLRSGEVPCLELRASMIVGEGSASFHMLRDLAARLPAMILPRWLENRTEPIAIDDVVGALVAGARVPLPESKIYDLEGPEVLSCREILLRVARILGVEPRTMGVPVLTPRLSSWWIRFVSGVNTALARELVDGLASDIVAERRGYRELAKLPAPVPFDEAVHRALAERKPRHASLARAWETFVSRLAPPHASGYHAADATHPRRVLHRRALRARAARRAHRDESHGDDSRRFREV